MPNIEYAGPARESSFRRMAMAAWDRPGDPSIYGLLDIDTTRAQVRLDALRDAGVPATWTHVVARAMALALARHRDANVMPRLARTWRREHIDIFLQVAMPDPSGELGETDLSGVKLVDADTKSLEALAVEVRERAKRIRAHDDPEMERGKKSIGRIPRWLLRPAFRLLMFLQYHLNLDLAVFGVPRDPFGSALVSSMGSLGIETAFAPLFPVGGPPLVILVGAVKLRPVVDEEGQIVARPMLRLGGTFDHRCFDGYHLACLTRALKHYLEEDVDAL